ncbi:MAG TPA: hypothetical protein VKK31_20130 [Thermoanaerobaculia bacterium]|nr:hypothetical protein [Thermoanaerobaculia bacterium]
MAKRGVALTYGLGALLFLLVSQTASAQLSCASGFLNPGQEVCTGTVFAPNNAEANGTGNGRNLRFRIFWAPSSLSPFTTIEDFTALGFTQIWNETVSPNEIPGYFFLCAKRGSNHAVGADYSICIEGQ